MRIELLMTALAGKIKNVKYLPRNIFIICACPSVQAGIRGIKIKPIGI